ncbi:hypothetical protein DFH09DRAFT_1124274 [Mycena vulgaris]|nr:hypothetical protein DFH09DRAFT_1124274 [Mycena vulgaris]
MISLKLAVLVTSGLIALASASPTTTPPVTPPNSNQCCTRVVPSSSAATDAVAALLGLDLFGLGIDVGLSCSPITVIGNNCGGTSVTCDAPEVFYGGLIAINCIPIQGPS